MSSATEFELTFLLQAPPQGYDNRPCVRIEDVYFPSNIDRHARLRFRRQGDRYSCTKKMQVNEGDASEHIETTILLEADEWMEIVAGNPRRVIKDRYELDVDGRLAELDVFAGHLEGLVLIDFEFVSRDDLELFEPPKFAVADVTQEEFIAGGVLAGRSLANIVVDLRRCGWKG